MTESIDILENNIFKQYPKVLDLLLKDHSVSHKLGGYRYIIWATSDYKEWGEGYDYLDQIKPEKITGKYGNLIQPRVKKSREIQQQRVQDRAEVFTPAWICNKQNNLIDNAWFERENVFNIEIDEENQHKWETNTEKVQFPDGKPWQDYVCVPRLEISCGEAPYITSRYDVTQGDEPIPVENRIGFLDRKLRIVNENTNTHEDWLKGAFNALHNTYGFEWQGDNLLLAREAVLFTFIEHYRKKFQKELSNEKREIENAAYIISWNLWQMDGVKCVVPLSCEWAAEKEQNLFWEGKKECPACKNGEQNNHIGIKCEVVEWEKVTQYPHIGTKKNRFYYPKLNTPIKQ